MNIFVLIAIRGTMTYRMILVLIVRRQMSSPFGGYFFSAPPVDNLWITSVMHITPISVRLSE